MASDKEGCVGKFMSAFCYETDTVVFLTACENEHEERLLSPRHVEGCPVSPILWPVICLRTSDLSSRAKQVV